MKNIKILGAGISGLTAAINLAKAGYRVDVFEKNKDVGMGFHGDLQGLENWSKKKDILEELEEMNIEINFDCNPFLKLTITNGSISKDLSNLQKPFFYLVKRGYMSNGLDCGLKKQAIKAGANIHFQKTIPCSEADIIATGSIQNKIVGVAKGIVFKTNAKDSAVLAANNELAFKGYSYLLITRGYGCICSVVIDRLDKVNDNFKKTKEFFIKKFNIDIQSPKWIGGVGSFSLKNIFREGTALYVGEVAGLQDLLLGFGMRYAINSGYLAAQSIINNRNYEKIAKKYFKNRLRASIVNRYLWEKIFSKKNYSFVINNGEFIKNNFYSIYNYNLLQRIIYPVALFYLKKKYSKLEI